MSTALRSVGFLDVLSVRLRNPSVVRLVSMPVCAASLRNLWKMPAASAVYFFSLKPAGIDMSASPTKFVNFSISWLVVMMVARVLDAP